MFKLNTGQSRVRRNNDGANEYQEENRAAGADDPAGHRDLLRGLGVHEEEIREIDDWCRQSIAKEFLQLRLLYLLFSVVCLYGIWNSIWRGDLLPFGLPCPAFLRFLLTAPASMIPLAILLVGEGVSLWIVPLLPDQEKPTSR